MGRKPKYVGQFKAGDTFGSWTVVDGTIHGSPAQMDVRCTCGTEKRADVYSLVKRRSTSCGCQLKSRVGENNPNWKGVDGISGTTLYQNSARTGLSRDDLVVLARAQNYSCVLTGGGITGSLSAKVEPVNPNVPLSVNNAVWVSSEVSPMVRSAGIVGTVTVSNSVLQTAPHNIFDKLGMKPGGV
jgi:hypothetical protein